MEHLRYLESQFLDDEFADIQFIIERDLKTEKIPAHKVILSAGSLMLKEQFVKCRDMKKIAVENATPEAFKEFLFTFYSKFPEKNFTIVNTPEVLNLARTFQVAHCFKSTERFLLNSLTTEQMFFGYSIADEFALHDLKEYCQKQIDENKRDTFFTSSFFGCTQDVLYDVLEKITVNDHDDIKVVLDAFMKWAEKQCIIKSMDSSDMNVRRYMLGKCFNQIQSIVSKDGEILSAAMNLYAGLFPIGEQLQIQHDENPIEEIKNDMTFGCGEVCDATKNDISHFLMPIVCYPDISSTIICSPETSATICNPDINQNDIIEELEFVRFSETILSPQALYANDPIIIELQSTKQIALNGIAFSTVTGTPRGKLCIAVRHDDGETTIVEQQLNSKTTRFEPRNFFAIENVVLEPSKSYVIKVVLSKDTVYRSSRRIASTFHCNDFTVTVKAISRRDIFSHFLFSEYF